jgi:hypothetical protein
MITRTTALVLAAALLATGSVAAHAGKKKKHEPKPSVTYAKTWEAAVEEAKTLNVPLVVHSHGFY